MTSAVSDTINDSTIFGLEVNKAFERYQNCDWSDMNYEEDKVMNAMAIAGGKDRIRNATLSATWNVCSIVAN